MTKLIRSVVLGAAALLPVSALAHPGPHAADAASDLVHAFAQPDHLLSMAAVGLWIMAAVHVARWFAPWRKESWSL